MVEEIKCPECESDKIVCSVLLNHPDYGESYDYKKCKCKKCGQIFPVIYKLEELLDNSLSSADNISGDSLKEFIEKEKKSFASLKSEDECASIDNEAKTKRYFVSYNHTYKERFGFGNIITETNSFDIREIEKFIKAECNFSDVVILYYKEMEEDEK